MFVSFDKREFQQTMMVYHYYNLVYKREFEKGLHIPIGGGKPILGKTPIDESSIAKVKSAITREGRRPTGEDAPINVVKKLNNDIMFSTKGDPKTKFILSDRTRKIDKAGKGEDVTWNWKGEDPIWAHYMGFIANRSLVYFYAKHWTSYSAKAKYIGNAFSEIVSNIESDNPDSPMIKVTTTSSLNMTKREFQHFMMLYHFYNLDQMDILLERLDDNKSEGQWMNEDRPWYYYMILYDNRGLTNYLHQKFNVFSPKVRNIGFRMIEEITNSYVGDNLRIRIAV